MSLRALGRMHGVSRTTVAAWLKAAGKPRRGAQEGNQRRWPRVSITCPVCGAGFGRRPVGDAAHGVGLPLSALSGCGAAQDRPDGPPVAGGLQARSRIAVIPYQF